MIKLEYSVHAQQMTELEAAAATLGISLLSVPVGTAQDLPGRFEEMIAGGADAYLNRQPQD